MIPSTLIEKIVITKEEFLEKGVNINCDNVTFKAELRKDFSPYNNWDVENIEKYKDQDYYNLYLFDKMWILLDWVGFPNINVFEDGTFVDFKGILNSFKLCAIDYYILYQKTKKLLG